jgi:hypothetical protein
MYIAALVLAAGQASLNPQPGLAAEAAQPFCYYLEPSDEIGFKDCPVAFQITYDGAINNGFGELDLSAGATPTPVNVRVKTFYKNHLPIVRYAFDRDGARYEVEAFAKPMGLDPSQDLIGFVRVKISNRNSGPVKASLQAAYNPRAGEERSELECRPWYQAKFMDAASFGAYAKAGQGSCGVSGGNAYRNENLVFQYTGTPSLDPSRLSVTYDYNLQPGQSETIDLKVPFVPVSIKNYGLVKAVAAERHDGAFRDTVKFWESLYSRALNVQLDDPKVVDTMLSSLTYDLMARDIEADGKHFTQTVNKFQYHGFFARDTSFIARSYELLNLPEVARTTVEKYLVRDSAGAVQKFLRTSPDDWGQSLWAVGSYFRTSGDVAFAREIHPAIAPHLDEFEKSVADDPLGLWPVAGPYDNELIDGHYTSHNLWALLGLREAENMCRAVGDTETANRAHRLYEDFYHVFVSRLKPLADNADGYIPPGMDDARKGYDWENASGGVYPFHVFPPDNPWALATVRMEREYKYREGIMTWGPNAWVGKVAARTGAHFDPQYLHDYDTFQVAETELAQGDQRSVVEDLYSTLVHTSATNGGFETSIRPWGNRDPDGNFPPHGWFAARYNELLRNMLLREVDDELHIASALAPNWVRPGRSIKVTHGANSFGTLDYSLNARSDGADVQFKGTWRTKPERIVFHIPWFVRLDSAEADGKPVDGSDGVISLPATVRKLKLNWTWTDHPDLSYDRAVKLWLAKNYDPSPGEDTDHLFPTKTRPAFAESQTLFANSYPLRIVSRSGLGKVHFTMDGSSPSVTSPVFDHEITIRNDQMVRAIEIYPDGSASDEIVAKLLKATLNDPANVPDAQPGASFWYYEGEFGQMPDFGKLQPTRSGIATMVDLGAIVHRPEQFAITASGFIRAPIDGIYSFGTGSDDGSKLWIDGQLVVDNDGPHPYTEVFGVAALKAGLHKVRVDYFDAGGANYLRVFWKVPGKRQELIPASAWFHGS